MEKLHVSVDSLLLKLFFSLNYVFESIQLIFSLFHPSRDFVDLLCSMAYIKNTVGMLNILFLNNTQFLCDSNKISRGIDLKLPT